MAEMQKKLSDYLKTGQLRNLIASALAEDVGSGDITTLGCLSAQSKERTGNAKLIAKSSGLLSGSALFIESFRQLDSGAKVNFAINDGSSFNPGETVATIQAQQAALLTAERVALNFLGRLSGIATLTAKFVERAGAVKILDTRKTTPLWRALEKYAVVCGGGENHRTGLYNMALIKENHIASAGSITHAVENLRRYLAENNTSEFSELTAETLEVEVNSAEEITEALSMGVLRLLIDNQTPENLRELVRLAREIEPRVKLEASGNVTLETVAEYAKCGVDYISVGSLTHSAPSADFSLLLEVE